MADQDKVAAMLADPQMQELVAQAAAALAAKPAAVANGSAPAVAEIDLDAELAALDLSAQPVRIGGRTYLVRRDLKVPEITEYWKLANGNDEAKALGILVGEQDAGDLLAYLNGLEQQKINLAVRSIMRVAGVFVGEGGAGESKAS